MSEGKKEAALSGVASFFVAVGGVLRYNGVSAEDSAQDGLNWYTYCGNNPIYYSDPSGYSRVVTPNTSSGGWSIGYTNSRLYGDVSGPSAGQEANYSGLDVMRQFDRINAERSNYGNSGSLIGQSVYNAMANPKSDAHALELATAMYIIDPSSVKVVSESEMDRLQNKSQVYNSVAVAAGAAAVGAGAVFVAVAAGVVVGVMVVKAGVKIYEASKNKPTNMPAWNKVKVNMDHIISGHTSGGGRGNGGKDNFPPGMTEAAILKAIEEAYKHAEKIGELQYSWQNGVEQARQLFQGSSGNMVIQFWFNHTTKTIETAWPK